MNTSMSTSDHVALIERRHGMQIDTYRSTLDCVLHLVNNGRLGDSLGGIGWGSKQHKAAIYQLKEKIAEVEAGFAEQDAHDAAVQAVTHTTEPGESLAGIALRRLGDAARWTEVRDLNADGFPDMRSSDYYPVGTVLRLPGHPA